MASKKTAVFGIYSTTRGSGNGCGRVGAFRISGYGHIRASSGKFGDEGYGD